MTANVIRSLSQLRTVVLGGILFFATNTALFSQESPLEELPGLRERAVIVHIISRIVEDNQQVWSSENSRVTLPGRPVGLKLEGTNLVVAVQFTPFVRPNAQPFLVAQGQIWINIPNEGMRYHTTIQTIPLEFNEQIIFFPLGSMETPDEALIEIQLVFEPYSGNIGERGASAERGAPSERGASTDRGHRRRGNPDSP